ncbi:MAG: acyl-CoA dehydrogenase family protein [Candidatus Omnitrophica bacterium]|nr:acyl-CoA dehydrogenase family protein [Candidatus Omnitrophota bacterium]
MASPASVPDPLLGSGAPEAFEVTEAARETEWRYPSFIAELFMGRLRTDLLLPYPEQEEADRRVGDAFLSQLEPFLKEHVDPDEIDRTGEMPPAVIEGLKRLGCFGMKIPKAYGGVGLSQTNYNRVIALIGSYCGSTAVWLSAHQSIGAPQPLILFGTEEQKRRYLPRLARGAVSAFALTESGVGSDPANMVTTATPVDGGAAYLLNGEKLWCTNGPVAELVVVMARTPSLTVGGRERKQITAFLVERSMPGVEVVHRCDFMGLKGIQNGVLRFTNVRVPKEHIIWGIGLGLKLALVTLNAGRIAIPAGCVGTAKRCLQITRQWVKERKQWGGPIGKHEAVAAKVGAMAATTFAMDAMVWFASALVDRQATDVRLEAAIAKLFCSEACWRIIDDTLQLRGGRGYETARSLRARGEAGIPVERFMRDGRINLIIEGTSQIMRLFIAREVLDAHMRLVSRLLDPRQSPRKKLGAAMAAFGYYALWYPRQWLAWSGWLRHAALGPRLGAHLCFIERMSHRLARALFHSAIRHQARLAYRQQLLGRLVDIGGDLFAMAAACSKANDDRQAYRTAQEVMGGRFAWLEAGIL